MKRLVLTAFVSLMLLSAWAIPARRGGIIVTQSDGSQITVYQHGDEHFHWMTNENGEWIERTSTGDFQVVKALSADEIATRRMQSSRQVTGKQQASELNIAPRGLIILVNFQDVQFQTSRAEMDSMINGSNYIREYSYKRYGKTYNISSQGSVKQYFQDVSAGQYQPQFDVVGPVTVSKNMAYYGANNQSTGSDLRAEAMIAEACKLVNDSVDFTLYDNNNSGDVDFVYVFYAGFGEADGGGATTIWPHQYYLSQYQTVRLDGKLIDRYACSNELSNYSKHHEGIGSFCHEFSHVLGLPDLYSTDDYAVNHRTCVDWDIMDYGAYNNDGNTPPSYSSYERFFMGWLTPRVLTDCEIVTLNDLQTTNEALLICSTDEHNLVGNDPNPTTFYMIENRQQTGWDSHLAGHGMMLTKIAYSSKIWFNNTVNNKPKSMGVDIIEADGIAEDYSDYGTNANYWGKPTDLFPAGSTEYLGIAEHPIKDIKEKDGVITFNYKDAPSAVEDVQDGGKIVAIYNLLGQPVSTTDVLPQGTYIIKTTQGVKKITIQ